MNDKTDKTVSKLPLVPEGEVPQEAADALAEKGDGQNRLVGYILSPESMAELADQVENIPGRYYKRMVPALQNASQLIEKPDGTFTVIGPN